MDIKNVLFAKIIAGIAITGGVGGATAAYIKNRSQSFDSTKDNVDDKLKIEKDDDFVPDVQVQEETVKSLAAEENSYLITTLNSKNNENKPEELLTGGKKNYYCQIEQNKKIDCEVSLVVFDETKKSVDLSTIKDLTSSTGEKTILKDVSEGTYFKLKLNTEDLSKFNSSSTKAIDLVSNSPKTKTVFATLSPEFRVQKGDVEAVKKTVVVVVVVAAKESSSSDAESVDIKQYKCASDNMARSKECTIHNFSNDINSTEEISNIDFSTNVLTVINAVEKIKDETKLSALKLPWVSLGEINALINFEPYKNDISDDENKKTYKLTPKARLFGNLEKNTKGVFFELITIRGHENQSQK